MKVLKDVNGVLTIGMLVRICFILGLGAGFFALPFMVFAKWEELGFVEFISMLALVPLSSGLLMVFYVVAGYWLYSYFVRHDYFGLNKIIFLEKNGSR